MLVTAGLHALCTMATALPGVLAPVAARDFGLPAAKVGAMQALHYFTTIFSGLVAAPLLARMGPVRVLQVTALTTALAALSCGVAGWVAVGNAGSPSAPLLLGLWLLATGILFGTGYGLINPVSANVLFVATPPAMRSLVFSIKQTSVPVGFGLAGVAFPFLVLVLPWQWVCVVMAAVLVLVALAINPVRLVVQETVHSRRQLLRWSDFSSPLRDVLATRIWRRRALMALSYSITQTAATAYLVSFLSLEIGLSLVAAGSVFAIAQIGGVTGRIGLGAIADRWVKPRLQLGLAGIATAIFSLSMVAITPQWPLAAITVLCALFGIVSFAWNGVFFAETASIAPAGRIGHYTGGIQVFISLGAMLGPGLYALIVTLSDSYALGFALLAIPSLLVGILFVLPDDAAAPDAKAGA